MITLKLTKDQILVKYYCYVHVQNVTYNIMMNTILRVSVSEDDIFVVEQITSGSRLCSCYLLKV